MTNLTAQGSPELPPPAEWALQIAAQAWCEPTTSDIEMDERLATVFAQHLTKLAAAFEAARQARQAAPEAPRVPDVAKMVEEAKRLAEGLNWMPSQDRLCEIIDRLATSKSQLARDFPPMGGLTECDMGDSDE